jgi:membrane fusion protein
MSNNDPPLFRREVLSARSTQWTGSIILRRPVPIRIAAAVSLVIAVFAISFAWTGHYTRSVHVNGQLVPSTGAIKMVAPQFALVVKKAVKDGDVVKEGQLLYELSSEREGESGGIDSRITTSLAERRELLAQERSLQAQQLQQHQRMLETRRQLIDAELGRLEQEISLQQQRAASAAKTWNRYKSLREQGFVSELQLTQYENDYDDQLARVQTLERAKLSSTRDLLQAKEEANQVNGQIRLNVAQSESTIATLDQESAEHEGRSRIQIIASAAGTVTALAADPGQTVNAGTVLATIIPVDSELEAHLLAPSRAIGFIEPGQTVQLRLAAFPYQKFGQAKGTVIRVEQSPIVETQGPTAVSDMPASEPFYRIVVHLAQQSVNAYGKEQKYKAGMTLEANIRQDRRRLVDWVIDPIISVAKGRTD